MLYSIIGDGCGSIEQLNKFLSSEGNLGFFVVRNFKISFSFKKIIC